ncbi:MAG: PEP-CTERM sorting domain-containing protein [Planctomycetes bacterium]|nr:PEP-CTERM sorting domain-containing protein [Planctomycetota bacterium]
MIYKILAVSILAGLLFAGHTEAFDFKEQIFGAPSTMALGMISQDLSTGFVDMNGVDWSCPSSPFIWDWGDGSAPEVSWFPAQHTYTDLTNNYLVTVTSNYPDGTTDSAETQVRFTAPVITPVALPEELSVMITYQPLHLYSKIPGYSPPSNITYYEDSHFGMVSRDTIEYVLNVAATIQYDFANGDVDGYDGDFKQVMYRDPNISGGQYSLWFTRPYAAFAASTGAVSGTIEYSSFMHEMGHNVTLNSPAGYFFGYNTDGCASEIYSETMAQIYQHATGYEIINNAASYGLSDDLVLDIKHQVIGSMRIVRDYYEQYLDGGRQFSSWNDPNTPDDETTETFMTIAFKFCEHAENSGQGYRIPLQRMMELLQNFNSDWADLYDPMNDNAAADAFRATLMVAALSHGFDEDLRSEFLALNFPIDNGIFTNLMATVPEPATLCLLAIGTGAFLRRKKRQV